MAGSLLTPSPWRARSGRVVRRVINPKTVMTVRTAEGTAEVAVPADRQRRASLTRRQAGELAALGVRIEELYGTPMDVEWCRDGAELFVLQARPITTGPTDRDPWNDSRAGDFLWTNTNVGEAIPDVMTPATWSMVQVFLSDAMATASIPPYLGYGRIGGRIYLNVSVMMSLSRAAGVSEQSFRNLTAEVFGQLPDDLEIPPIRASRLAHPAGDRADGRARARRRPAGTPRCSTRTWPGTRNAATSGGRDIAAITTGPRPGADSGPRCSTRSSTRSAGCCRPRPGPAGRLSSPPGGGCSGCWGRPGRTR